MKKQALLLSLSLVLSTIGAMDMQLDKNQLATQQVFQLVQDTPAYSYEQLQAAYVAIGAAIAEGADLNGKDINSGRTPLATAAFLGKSMMFDHLVKQGAAVDSEDLVWAVAGAKGFMIEKLIKTYKIPVNSKLNGYSPLHQAIRMGDKGLAQLLLNEGAEIEKSDYGWGSEFDQMLSSHK